MSWQMFLEPYGAMHACLYQYPCRVSAVACSDDTAGSWLKWLGLSYEFWMWPKASNHVILGSALRGKPAMCLYYLPVSALQLLDSCGLLA